MLGRHLFQRHGGDPDDFDFIDELLVPEPELRFTPEGFVWGRSLCTRSRIGSVEDRAILMLWSAIERPLND